jgi:hypothetical protein
MTQIRQIALPRVILGGTPPVLCYFGNPWVESFVVQPGDRQPFMGLTLKDSGWHRQAQLADGLTTVRTAIAPGCAL